jgi:hypothetical protein
MPPQLMLKSAMIMSSALTTTPHLNPLPLGERKALRLPVNILLQSLAPLLSFPSPFRGEG